MTEHTPGPWEIIGRSIYQTETAGGREVIHGSGIKGRDSEDRNREDVIKEAEANARFIVTACNCHAELLEALKRLRLAEKDCNALSNWDEGFEDWADVAELKEAQKDADEAIRHAEEQS
ncbi:MAG: hypothetical protein E3J37_03415 [Anaerolineales bacterium]|nr:MAG: hypothetical protein E3J37_03415 [Anaerolineales bacterium]